MIDKAIFEKMIKKEAAEILATPGVIAAGLSHRTGVLSFVVVVESEDVKIDLPKEINGLPVHKEIGKAPVNEDKLVE